MTKEYSETLTEVSEILKYMKREDVNKIPKALIEFIDANKSKTYQFFLTPNVDFSNQNIKRETLAFLTFLSLNFWCKDEEKNNLYKSLKKNEEIYEEELINKYNYDKLFNKAEQLKKEKKEEQKKLIVQHPKTLFSRLIEKIRSFFKL